MAESSAVRVRGEWVDVVFIELTGFGFERSLARREVGGKGLVAYPGDASGIARPAESNGTAMTRRGVLARTSLGGRGCHPIDPIGRRKSLAAKHQPIGRPASLAFRPGFGARIPFSDSGVHGRQAQPREGQGRNGDVAGAGSRSTNPGFACRGHRSFVLDELVEVFQRGSDEFKTPCVIVRHDFVRKIFGVSVQIEYRCVHRRLAFGGRLAESRRVTGWEADPGLVSALIRRGRPWDSGTGDSFAAPDSLHSRVVILHNR